MRLTLHFVDAFVVCCVDEFRHPEGHFDWHVDVKPNDGTLRTVNINVMLSTPGHDFTGGALQVGGSLTMPEKGSLYAYSAAMPHRVQQLNSGHRYTLIIALTERRLMAQQDEANSARRRAF